MRKTLREIQSAHCEQYLGRTMREAAQASGYSPDELKAYFEHPQLSFKKLREAAESSFPQLLRAGVQNFLFDAYQQVEVVYPELVRVVNSTKAEELYAPLYGAEEPKEVRAGQGFEDSRILGLDKRLKNRKFGRILSVQRELVDDDQTGQIQQRAEQLGQRVRILEERTVITAIEGANYTTAIGNRPSGFGALTQATLETASIALDTIKDPMGNLIVVNPNVLLISPSDKFNAAKLLNSTLQPSVPGSAGSTGYTMTVNPLSGLFKPVSSRFLTSGAWYLQEAQKSVVFQDRDPLEVVMEASNAGASFDHDEQRHRVRRRFTCGVIEERYLYKGN